ncbi:MAG: phosphatidate cytidylyltransferase [Eubacterium sp.]|nr:phosphatidate cytidylyltransferase [Eubacterium sp.]
MFITRLLSGIVLLAAAALLFVVGDIWLVIALGILSLVGVYELFRIWGMEKHPLAIVTYVATVGCYAMFIDYPFNLGLHEVMPIIALLALLTVYVIRYPKDHINQVAKSIFALIYVPVMMSFIYLLREFEMGEWLIWLVLISSWGADTCAYCVGKLIGKHHFSELSPKKTIEGCVGGIVGAALIAFGYAWFVPEGLGEYFILDVRIMLPVVAAISALISQIGDLSASAIKRNYEVKDYGKIIPGHGGVLDRFDSVIFVAPFIYILLYVFARVMSYVAY